MEQVGGVLGAGRQCGASRREARWHENSEVRGAWPEKYAWLTTFLVPVVTRMQTEYCFLC